MTNTFSICITVVEPCIKTYAPNGFPLTFTKVVTFFKIHATT